MPAEVIETIKPGGGGDFTTLQSWESSLPVNLVTDDEVRIAEVYSGGNASDGSTTITIQGQTTDLTRYIEIRAAPGHEHKGTGRIINRSKAYIEIDANVAGIDIRSNYVRIVDMQINGTSALSAGLQVISTFTDSSIAQIRMTRCVTNKDAGGSVVFFRGGGQSDGRDNINKSCVFIGNGGSSSAAICNHNRRSVSNEGRTRYNNCTIISRGTLTDCFREGGLGHRIRSNNCYLKAGGVAYQGNQSRYSKIGGDATNTTEASHALHKSILYTNDNFVDITSGSENLHIIASGVLADTGDNRNNGPFTLDRGEFVVLKDFEGDNFALASGTFTIPGSGYFIGADAIVPNVGPAVFGGYIRSTADGPVSGFLGAYTEGGPLTGPTGFLGGYVLAKAVTGNNLFAILGGYTRTDGGIKPPSFMGGFVFSIPVKDEPPVSIGAFASGLTQAESFLGGCIIGRPDKTQFVATRARNLVVATSDNVVDQGLEFDAQIIFKQIFEFGINAKVDNVKTRQNDISAKVEVQKFRIPPTVFIQSVTTVVPSGEVVPSGQPIPTFNPSGVRQICVTASGILGDAESWIGARINFGDPFGKLGGFKPLLSVSGFAGSPPWTTCHDYDISGLYVISVRGQDNDGMVGSDISGLNLASGTGFGTHFPAISISGIPRFGIVPLSLQVDFTTFSSGILVPPFTAAQSAASQPQSPTDERIHWDLGNRETSRRKNPRTFYSSPGLYAPTLVFHFTSPSGGQYIVSDSLLVGFNN